MATVFDLRAYLHKVNGDSTHVIWDREQPVDIVGGGVFLVKAPMSYEAANNQLILARKAGSMLQQPCLMRHQTTSWYCCGGRRFSMLQHPCHMRQETTSWYCWGEVFFNVTVPEPYEAEATSWYCFRVRCFSWLSKWQHQCHLIMMSQQANSSNYGGGGGQGFSISKWQHQCYIRQHTTSWNAGRYTLAQK